MGLNNRGRPKKNQEITKTKQFKVRLTDEEAHMLEYLANNYGLNKSDILRSGIKMQYYLSKKD